MLFPTLDSRSFPEVMFSLRNPDAVASLLTAFMRVTGAYAGPDATHR